MIRAEQIPDEVMAAARLAHQNSESYRVAIAAALNAWPGMEIHTDGTEDWIELTLTQEKP